MVKIYVDASFNDANPNTNIIGKREAKLIIGISSTVTDYISGYLDK